MAHPATASRPPLSGHRAFVPLVGTWLAALLGGSVAVLPEGQAAMAARRAGLDLPQLLAGDMALAMAAALAGLALGVAAARALAARQAPDRHRLAAHEPRVAPPPLPGSAEEWDAGPAAAEGRESPRDAAPETVAPPEGGHHHAQDACPAGAMAGSDGPASHDAPVGAPAPAGPDEAEALVVAAQSPLPEAPQARYAAVGTAPAQRVHGKAVQLLRSDAPENLAMPALVERFAVALDDHRHGLANGAHSYSREAARPVLAAALRKLSRPH